MAGAYVPTSSAEAAFAFTNEHGAFDSYANDASETCNAIKRCMLLRYTNWNISDDVVNGHMIAVLPPWASYHSTSNGLGLRYVFIDFKTARVQVSLAPPLTWNSILNVAESGANMEVFTVRGCRFHEGPDAYLEVYREFVDRAAKLVGKSGELEPDMEGISFCRSRGQWKMC